ncbi:hypothetical protein HDV05_005197 [Chytridiales sp. JEL 0842]|nr:hypothetical protein HDV05_005197 [Chytridiales sp. JEL 0842]
MGKEQRDGNVAFGKELIFECLMKFWKPLGWPESVNDSSMKASLSVVLNQIEKNIFLFKEYPIPMPSFDPSAVRKKSSFLRHPISDTTTDGHVVDLNSTRAAGFTDDLLPELPEDSAALQLSRKRKSSVAGNEPTPFKIPRQSPHVSSSTFATPAPVNSISPPLSAKLHTPTPSIGNQAKTSRLPPTSQTLPQSTPATRRSNPSTPTLPSATLASAPHTNSDTPASTFDIAKTDILQFLELRDHQHRQEREQTESKHREDLARLEAKHLEHVRKLAEDFRMAQDKLEEAHSETVQHLRKEIVDLKTALEGGTGSAPKRWIGLGEGVGVGGEVVAWDFQPLTKTDQDVFKSLLDERNAALRFAQDAKVLAEASMKRSVDCEVARNRTEELLRIAERDREVAVNARLAATEQLEKVKKEAKFLREKFAGLSSSVGSSPMQNGTTSVLGTPGGPRGADTPVRFEYPGRFPSQKGTPTA